MTSLLVPIVGWTFSISFVGAFVVTCSLRFYVRGYELGMVQGRLPLGRGGVFVKKAELTARGLIVWKIRNCLAIIAAATLPLVLFLSDTRT